MRQLERTKGSNGGCVAHWMVGGRDGWIARTKETKKLFETALLLAFLR